MDKLVKMPGGQLTTKKSSPKALSGISIVRMLDLAAKMTGYKELTATESDLWLEFLTPYPASDIEKAFKAYLAVAEFFPKPAQILALLNAAYQDAKAASEEAKTTAMLEENRQMRERLKEAGLPYGPDQYQGFIRDAIALVKKVPEPTPGRRAEIKKQVAELRKGKQDT